MRISDWSSDVSSDLVETARANIARLDFVEDFHAVDDRAVLALASEAADIARPARRLGRRQFVDDIVGARSEEHTSELQSLMRISYAVFCLKKTKQTNIYNTMTSDYLDQ